MYTRDETIKLGTHNPGFESKPFNNDIRSKGTLDQIPLAFSTSGGPVEIHHVMGVQDHLRPLIQGLNERQQIGIMNRLISKGVNLGNDPRNLIALLKPDHRAVHSRMKEVQLEPSSDKQRLEFLNKFSSVPYEQRLIVADTFAEHMYPAIVEEMHGMGYMVPTQADNIQKYKESVLQENLAERTDYGKEILKEIFGEKPNIENIRAARDAKDIQAKEYAQEHIRQQAEKISDSQGQIIGQKPFVINADKGSKVFVHTNGNGNGHAEMQEKFNNSNGNNGIPRRRG